jgi:SAM-dependent methyltransferase
MERPRASTWHYGVVARWWAEFNEGGPEIKYFQRYIDAGQPALDVACGTGRLLLPYVRAGLDVDGCDISEDMLALCGLEDVCVRGQYTDDAEPTVDDDFLVYVAQRGV